MSKTRWIFLLVYCAALLVGTGAIFLRHASTTAAFKTTRAISSDRLIHPSDLVAPATPVGYLKKDRGKDLMVAPDDVVALPTLRQNKGSIPIAFAVGRDLVRNDSVNAGARIHICKSGKPVIAAAALSVRTVMCADQVGECIAIIDIPSDKAAELKEFAEADTLTAKPLKSKDKPCE